MNGATYRVTVVRDDVGWWTANVTDVDGAHAEARTLAGIDNEVREVIALVLDLPEGAESSLDLVWDIRTDQDDLD